MFAEVELMAKKKGEKYACPECGLVIVIEDDGCECQECDVVCCTVPMELVEKPKKAAAKKAKPKAKAKPKTKPTKKKPTKKK
jgi:predicted ATP-dependent serine protease